MNRISDDPTSTPADGFPRPPLQIRHLLLWTACSAVFLGIVTVGFPRSEWVGSELIVLIVLSSFSAGGGLTGLILLYGPIRRGERLAPGEMLLQIFGLFYLAVVLYLLAIPNLGPRGFLGNDSMVDVCVGIGRLLLLVVGPALGIIGWMRLLVAAFRARVWHWRLLFLTLFVLPFLPAVVEWLIPSFVEYGIFAILVIVTGSTGLIAWRDGHYPTRYPWTHWAGLLCCGWVLLAVLIGAISNRLQ